MVELRQTTSASGLLAIVQKKVNGKVFFLKSVVGKHGQRELSIMRKLGHHQNVAKVVDQIDAEDGSPKYLVSEYCPGLDLKEFLRWNWMRPREEDELEIRFQDPWPKIFRRNVLLALVGVVRFLHDQGVVHTDLADRHIVVDWSRDVTCNSIVMTSLKIIDFNSSIELDSPKSAISHAKLSCPRTRRSAAFMSPEMYLSCRCTKSTDIWSIGMTFFNVLERFAYLAVHRRIGDEADGEEDSSADEDAQSSGSRSSDPMSEHGSEHPSSKECWCELRRVLKPHFEMLDNASAISLLDDSFILDAKPGQKELFLTSKMLKIHANERWSAETLFPIVEKLVSDSFSEQPSQDALDDEEDLEMERPVDSRLDAGPSEVDEQDADDEGQRAAESDDGDSGGPCYGIDDTSEEDEREDEVSCGPLIGSDAFALLTTAGAWRLEGRMYRDVEDEERKDWSSRVEINFINSEGYLSRRGTDGRFSSMNARDQPQEKIVCTRSGSCARMSRRTSRDQWNRTHELYLEWSTQSLLYWKCVKLSPCDDDECVEQTCSNEEWKRHRLPAESFGMCC